MQLGNIKTLKELDKKRNEIIDKIESVKEISKKAGYDVRLFFRTKIEFIFDSESTYTRYRSIENHPNDNHDKYHEMNTNCIKTVLHIVEECLKEQLKMVEDDIKALKLGGYMSKTDTILDSKPERIMIQGVVYKVKYASHIKAVL